MLLHLTKDIIEGRFKTLTTKHIKTNVGRMKTLICLKTLLLHRSEQALKAEVASTSSCRLGVCGGSSMDPAATREGEARV